MSNPKPESQFPEHDKLHKVKQQSQACHDFLEWLAREKGFHLAYWHKHSLECLGWDAERGRINRRGSGPCCEYNEAIMYLASYNDTKLLAEFFKIDLKRLDAEKETMLKMVREQHEL